MTQPSTIIDCLLVLNQQKELQVPDHLPKDPKGRELQLLAQESISMCLYLTKAGNSPRLQFAKTYHTCVCIKMYLYMPIS